VPCCGFSSMLFASQRHECNLFLVWVCVGLCCTVPSSINAMMCSSPAYLREKKRYSFSLRNNGCWKKTLQQNLGKTGS
jgi:hypothetical protein